LECSNACLGNPNRFCGGYLRNSVYKVDRRFLTISKDRSIYVLNQINFEIITKYVDDLCTPLKIVTINQTTAMIATDCGNLRYIYLYSDSYGKNLTFKDSFSFSELTYSFTLFNENTVLLGSNNSILIFDLNSNSSTYVKKINEVSTITDIVVINKDLFAAGMLNYFISIYHLAGVKTKSLYQGFSVVSMIVSYDKTTLAVGDMDYNTNFFEITNNFANSYQFHSTSSRFAEYKDDYLIHIGKTFRLTNYTSKTTKIISSTNYDSIRKFDNGLIALGSISSNIELCSLNA
jgi:hypothetical protein